MSVAAQQESGVAQSPDREKPIRASRRPLIKRVCSDLMARCGGAFEARLLRGWEGVYAREYHCSEHAEPSSCVMFGDI